METQLLTVLSQFSSLKRGVPSPPLPSNHCNTITFHCKGRGVILSVEMRRIVWDHLSTTVRATRTDSIHRICLSNRSCPSCKRSPPFISKFDFYLSTGALHSGPVPLLHGRVSADRLPPAHPRLQHHAAGQHPPQMTACPAGGGGGRRRPLPALESRRAPWRGDALYCQPLQPRHSNHFLIKTGWGEKKTASGKIQTTRYVLSRKKV